MKNPIFSNRCFRAVSTFLLLLPVAVLGEVGYQSLQEKYDRLFAELTSLKGELDELRSQVREISEAKPIETASAKPSAESSAEEYEILRSQLNNAREWNNIQSNFHLAGYADVGYADTHASDGTFTLGSFSPIFHYLYKDLLMMESELEFEIDQDGETNVDMEYLSLDLFLNDYMTLTAGKFLSPIGQFRQNFHPSWINKLPTPPLGFGHDGAAPISDVGVQLRGGLPLGSMKANYAFFVTNGPTLLPADHVGAEASGIEGTELEINADGITADNNGNKLVGGRFGILPKPNLEIGFSLAKAQARFEAEEDRDYTVYDFDFFYRPEFLKLLTVRGEYVDTQLEEGGITDPEEKDLSAWFLQGSYLIPNTRFEAVLRYGELNESGANSTQFTPGLNFLFSNNIISKIAYEFNESEEGSTHNRILLQLSFGF